MLYVSMIERRKKDINENHFSERKQKSAYREFLYFQLNMLGTEDSVKQFFGCNSIDK